MTKYDDLPDIAQARMDRAVYDFLVHNEYRNLRHACEILNMPPQQVFDKIMAEAGLPECEMPLSIQVG